MMTDPENETETLERLERALRRIDELARQRSFSHEVSGQSGAEIDRAALLHSLDHLIERLRSGLDALSEDSNDVGDQE